MKLDVDILLLFWHTTATPIASVWTRNAEASASSDASASCYGVKENVGVLAIVEAPLKFIQVQRKVLRGNLVIGSHDAALQQRPERFNRLGMDDAANVFALAVLNDFVRTPAIGHRIVAVRFIGHDQIDPTINGFT